MSELIGGFKWRVAKAGYRVIEGHRKLEEARTMGQMSRVWRGVSPFRQSSDFLIVAPVYPEEGDVEHHYFRVQHDTLSYSPLEAETTLCFELAELGDDTEKILRFANKYGPLGGDIETSFSPTDQIPGFSENYPWSGEDLELWRQESENMALAFDIWNMLRDDKWSEFEHILKIDGDNCYLFDPERWGLLNAFICSKLILSERRADLERDGVQAGLKFVLRDIVSESISGRLSEQFDWKPDGQGMAFKLYPSNLIGSLWLQFADIVAVQTDYTRCVSCEKWFLVSPGTGRPDKKFCSNACRMRAYRNRKKDIKVKATRQDRQKK
ncbi:MAG: hypothetical protein RLO21_15915 [Nitratireductor sp.]